MASVNKVILLGNLGRDPELRTFPNGTPVCNVSVATTEKWRDRQTGEMRSSTEWHNIVFTDRLAEIAHQYLHKGSQVYIEGKLRTRKWQDRNTGVDRYTTEIHALVMQMLGSRQDNDGDNGYGYGNNNAGNYNSGYGSSGYGGGYGGASRSSYAARAERDAGRENRPSDAPDAERPSENNPPEKTAPAPQPDIAQAEEDIPF